MWDHYRRTFVLVQCLIFGICAIFVSVGAPLRALLVPFLVMQAGAFFGARWAARLKAMSNKDSLPPLRPQ